MKAIHSIIKVWQRRPTRLVERWRLFRRLIREHLAIALSVMFCLFFLLLRDFLFVPRQFWFLGANLILALVPLGVAVVFDHRYRHRAPGMGALIMLFLWLLFLPNAPYLITDLIHLRPRLMIPLWYDALLMFLFAFTGVMAGALSIGKIFKRLRYWIGRPVALSICMISVPLSGLGVYMGRFLRWNSWDFLFRPQHVLMTTFIELSNPMQNMETVGLAMVSAVVFASVCLFILPTNPSHYE